MQNEPAMATSPDPSEVTTVSTQKGEPLPRRPSPANAEPVLVELAWLVIEGAVFLRRLRALLARI
jgi:hypothetical protein